MAEPYYEDGLVRLYLGRCEDVLPELSGVQLTVTSPPYNTFTSLSADAGSDGKRQSWRTQLVGGGYDDNLPEPEYQAQQVRMARLVAEASTADAALFYNHKVRYRDKCPLHPLDLVRQFVGWTLRQEVIWARDGGRSHSSMFTDSDERIYWLVRSLGCFHSAARCRQWTTVWALPVAKVGRGSHPVPFPATIPERAILTATSRGDLVLPYAGSGTTLRVAKALGRRAVGIELREDYAEAAATMLAAM